MNTLEDLREVLNEEPVGLRAPDIHTVIDGGRRRRGRRTRAVGAAVLAAAAAVVVTGVLVGPRVLGGTEGPAATGHSPEEVEQRATAAQQAVETMRAELSSFTGQDPLDASEDSYALGTPDAEDGSGSVPRGSEQWASLLWWRFAFDVEGDAEMYVLVQNDPDRADTAMVGGVCTNVYDDCVRAKVPGGRVGIERGPASDGGGGPGEALRVSFTPVEAGRSWVLVELTTRSGEAPYTARQLVDLATRVEMSLPEPIVPSPQAWPDGEE